MAKRLNDTAAVAATPLYSSKYESMSKRSMGSGCVVSKSMSTNTEYTSSEVFHPTANPSADGNGNSMASAKEYLNRTGTMT